jgi:hypothetical protein
VAGGVNEAKIKLTAEDATSQAFSAVLKNVTSLKTELTGLPAKFTQIAIASAGIGSLAGFASMISTSIEAKAKLRDLSIQSNISVEALSSLSKVGKYSDTAIEDIASASTKLSKALFTQNEDSKGASSAIKALGLDYEKFKNLKPDEQMYEVAKALDRFQDGSEKSAVAMLLFGKQGAQLLPFLRELSERGLDVAKVTTKQAEEAKKYEDNLVALKAAGDEWKKTLATDMLPTLLEFTRELVEGRKAFGGWYDAIAVLGTLPSGKGPAENIGDITTKLADLRGQLGKIQSGDTAFNSIDKAITAPKLQRQIADYEKALRYFQALKKNQDKDISDEAKRLEEAFYGPVLKPKLQAQPNEDDASKLLRKQYEGQLKLIRDFSEQQKDAVEYANKYLKGAYDDGLLSLAAYFAEEKTLRDANEQAELDSIDKQIAAAKKLLASPKPEDRQQAENAIADATARRARIVQKSALDNVLATQEEDKAIKQLAFSYYDFLANIKSIKGDAQGATELRLAKQIRDAQDQLTKVGFDPGDAKAQAQAYGDLLRNVDALSRAQADYNRLMDSLGVTEKSIALDAQLSGASELDQLRAVGEERQKQLPLLQQLAEKAMAQAQAIGSPEALLAAQKLMLTFKQAAAEADPIFLRMRDIGKEMGDAIANDAEQAIVEWQGLRNLLGAIEKDILRIATRKLFTEPFGNYLSNAIGGNGTAAGGGGFLNSGFLAKLFNPGGGAASGGFGTGTQFGNLDFGGFFADGGTLKPGQWGIAGENGPEPIYAGATPVHITPNGGAAGGPVYVTINVPAGTSRQSASQIAAMAGDRVGAAVRRNR